MARPVLVCAYSDLSLAVTLLLILLSLKQVQVSESEEEAIPYTVAQHPCDYWHTHIVIQLKERTLIYFSFFHCLPDIWFITYFMDSANPHIPLNLIIWFSNFPMTIARVKKIK